MNYLLCEISVKVTKRTFTLDTTIINYIKHIEKPFLIQKNFSSGGTSATIDNGYIHELTSSTKNRFIYLYQINLDVYKKGTDDLIDWLMINTRNFKIKQIKKRFKNVIVKG